MRISYNHSSTSKPVAQRTCIACRKIKAKRELVRLVRTPEGSIEIDAQGKKAGRGVYLCPSWGCWEAGLKRKLEHSLQSSLTQENRERLIREAKELFEGIN